MSDQHMLIEGSAAVAIAAFEQVQAAYLGKNVVILLCGANIGLATLKEILKLAHQPFTNHKSQFTIFFLF